ncbi:Protein FAM172A [Takifugu flavidus]|uniref:Protein FAM172A n=1 Tax=Takifugu flavidus TaxID=433684 RepID=A0A5C6MYS1_9TELE|nr:Protein FAM172A [Takifugu flavidus]
MTALECNGFAHRWFSQCSQEQEEKLKDPFESRANENASSEEHVVHVWDHFVSKAEAKNVFIMAHSYGGLSFVELPTSQASQSIANVHVGTLLRGRMELNMVVLWNGSDAERVEPLLYGRRGLSLSKAVESGVPAHPAGTMLVFTAGTMLVFTAGTMLVFTAGTMLVFTAGTCWSSLLVPCWYHAGLHCWYYAGLHCWYHAGLHCWYRLFDLWGTYLRPLWTLGVTLKGIKRF